MSTPTNFKPGDETGEDEYKITVINTGGAASNGAVTIADTLPEGLRLDHAGVSGLDHTVGESRNVGTPLSCEGTVCTYAGVLIPEQTLTMTVPVDVEAGAGSSVTNVVTVSGGGAPDGIVSTPTRISDSPAGFGLAPGSVTTALSSTQAGAHADLTTSLLFNTIANNGMVADPVKETLDELPPGFAGDLVDMPTCAIALYSIGECPIGTQVGLVTLMLRIHEEAEPYTEPVYNLAPEPGDVAKLGFPAVIFNIQGDVTVRPNDYGLQTRFEDIHESGGELGGATLTVWGVPTDPIHDPWRFIPGVKVYGVSSPDAHVPYLSNPTSCSGVPLQASISARSWAEPETSVGEQASFGPLADCDRLTMPSTFVAQPTTSLAYAPTGLNAEVGVHQTYDNAEGLASAHLNKAVVTLPEGMTVNPSAGAGLGSCTPEQYAEETVEVVPGRGCPNDAKLGSVRIQAPAIKEEAFGSVYIATPYDNPFHSLLAFYMVARIPNRGVIVRAAGEVKADPLTGRLTTTFSDLPQLPFNTFTLSFRQGETSPLVSPPACGSYTAKAELTPWSDTTQVLDVESPPFEILQGFNGGACPAGGVSPFNPSVIAGTQDNDAGSYSAFDIRITRNDGEQEITGFASHLPPGLTASLTGVPFCSEADIALARSKTGAQEEAEPSCPVASQIGHTLVGAGVGSVLAYAPGKMYMAGPFEGAPFSIVAITSAKVGPFDLGTVVVHLPLQIDPITAAVSVPAGASDQIPHIIDGIIIHVRDIRVYIDRPNFTINPTNCDPMRFSATVIGSGASFTNPDDDQPVGVTDPFQEANCSRLAFKPVFSVSTSGKTSRSHGASLSVKLTYPNAPQGTQANIAQVKVDLPKQLPSRLTTLQKACTEQVFASDPAGCPAASIIGHAIATTPILPVPLSGPAYFVSHGGAKFPELVIVLQGDGVTLDLHGETFISKAGITSSTFRTIPDDPIGSFQLTLPEGPYSALAANGNLCKTKLKMPTAFTAQNGAVIHQSTAIAATGCPKAKNTKKTKKAKKARQTEKAHKR
ncbi:MAG TPA: hypothetical protein VK691_12505 [Solirubrobacteraceae bacterium]|nr:hypothetical protein [Solirubrobacteraceae bacterium]